MRLLRYSVWEAIPFLRGRRIILQKRGRDIICCVFYSIVYLFWFLNVFCFVAVFGDVFVFSLCVHQAETVSCV